MKIAHLFGAAALVLATFANVEARDSWKFMVYNKSSVAVKSFKTQEGGDWSRNWIRGDRMQPGDVFEMDFGTSKGDCEVRTRITFTDDSYFDEEIDYCEANNIYLYDRTIKWD